jgi:hypothetical protein
MKRIALILLLMPLKYFSQEIVQVQEKSLDASYIAMQEICKKLYSSKTDEEKRILNQELLVEVENAINQPNSFDFPFDSIKKDIHILDSDDGKFRIFNWDLPKEDGTFEYYGFIQSKHTATIQKKKTTVIQIYPLIDRSNEIRNPDNHIGDNKKWFGMWYYKIITKKTKSKTYYTLLGWDGNDNYSQKKIIDECICINGTFTNIMEPSFIASYIGVYNKYDKIIVEIKAQKAIEESHYKQVINYLAVSKLKLGILVNFGEESLKFKRIIL